jgi:hypothetical protein
MKDFGVVDLPWIKRTGNILIGPGGTPEIMLPNGNWLRIPFKLLE